MKRADLEHIIRAACSVTDDDAVVIVGSQSILGQFPNAPDELLVSNEADVYPRSHPERSDLIDGSLGELSPFHETFGYYAQGVQEGTATLPRGWTERLIPIQNARTHGNTGWCLEIHDLLVSKYVAGREKDLAFTDAAARAGLASSNTLLERLSITDIDRAVRDAAEARIKRDYSH